MKYKNSNSNSNSPSPKMTRNEKFIVLNEWFLTVLLYYLDMKEIVAMDSAICNKSDRDMWLKCITKGIGSVSAKIQWYLTSDESIQWCFKRNVRFEYLDLRGESASITARGVS